MKTLRSTLSRFRRLTLIQRYALATALTVLAAGGQWALTPNLDSHPLLLFFPPVVISALFLRHGTGLYAALLGSFLAVLFFIEPWGLAITNEHDTVAVFVLLALALILSPLLEAMAGLVDEFETTVLRQDVLLRELNHRAKNNLQLLMSMIMMQAAQTREPAARVAVLAIGDRISLLGQLQQRLVQPDGESAANAAVFLREVCAALALTMGAVRSTAIRVQAEPISLPPEMALPVGLIVNELVTNAIKHAFPEDQSGTVEIRLWRADAATVALMVTDDGVGSSPAATAGTGLSLIGALVQQFDGTLRQEDAGPGCRMIIHLPLPE
jgi:two-component sensor histidine kinase